MTQGCIQASPGTPLAIFHPYGDGTMGTVLVLNHIGYYASLIGAQIARDAGYEVVQIAGFEQTQYCVEAMPIWNVVLKVRKVLQPQAQAQEEMPSLDCPTFDPGPHPVHAPIDQGQGTYLVYAMAQNQQGAVSVAKGAAGNAGMAVTSVISVTPTHKCLQGLPVWTVYFKRGSLSPGQATPGGRRLDLVKGPGGKKANRPGGMPGRQRELFNQGGPAKQRAFGGNDMYAHTNFGGVSSFGPGDFKLPDGSYVRLHVPFEESGARRVAIFEAVKGGTSTQGERRAVDEAKKAAKAKGYKVTSVKKTTLVHAGIPPMVMPWVWQGYHLFKIELNVKRTMAEIQEAAAEQAAKDDAKREKLKAKAKILKLPARGTQVRPGGRGRGAGQGGQASPPPPTDAAMTEETEEETPEPLTEERLREILAEVQQLGPYQPGQEGQGQGYDRLYYDAPNGVWIDRVTGAYWDSVYGQWITPQMVQQMWAEYYRQMQMAQMAQMQQGQGQGYPQQGQGQGYPQQGQGQPAGGDWDWQGGNANQDSYWADPADYFGMDEDNPAQAIIDAENNEVAGIGGLEYDPNDEFGSGFSGGTAPSGPFGGGNDLPEGFGG